MTTVLQLAFRFLICSIAICVVSGGAARAGQGRYLEVEEFLDVAFRGAQPETAFLWIDDGLRARIEELIGHRFELLRVRYWRHADTTAWVLDEVGKDKPITIGVTVVAAAVENVRILEFRESRGWEVRHAFFTDQFAGVRASADRGLDRQIDGITGATLSVAAVSRAVRLGLFLSEQIGST